MQPASLMDINEIYVVDQLIILVFSHMFQKLQEGLSRYYVHLFRKEEWEVGHENISKYAQLRHRR